MLKRNLLSFVALLAVTPVAFAVKDDGGGYRAAPTPPPKVADPTMARKNFNIGFEEYQMATGMESAAAGQTGEKAASMKDAATTGFTRARDKFRSATVDDPKMKEAWNMLGFTSRKLGNFDDSLQAYEEALKLDPAYPEAIEYRAELYLLMGRLGDAKEAYGTLLKSAPPIAEVLKTSMKDWVKAKKVPSGVADADLKDFTAWVKKL
jgi:tetratricopeptide (TPR) repeat protein